MQQPPDHSGDPSPATPDNTSPDFDSQASFPNGSAPGTAHSSSPHPGDDPWQSPTPKASSPHKAPPMHAPRKKQSVLFVVATVVIATVVGAAVFGLTLLFTCVGVLAAVNSPNSSPEALLPFSLIIPFITAAAAAILTGGILLGLYSLFRK